MPLNIERRLVPIEAAIADYAPTCPTCEDWTAFLVRFRDADGSLSPERTGGWPAEEVPTCPSCGRTCPKVITFACDDRGPA